MYGAYWRGGSLLEKGVIGEGIIREGELVGEGEAYWRGGLLERGVIEEGRAYWRGGSSLLSNKLPLQ